MKRIFLCLLLALTLATSAAALEVPTDTVVQNLNGSQQLIKTYVLPPDTDPQKLIEEPFEQEGYLYSFAEIVKEENRLSVEVKDLGFGEFRSSSGRVWKEEIDLD